jgi:hypothetical protein
MPKYLFGHSISILFSIYFNGVKDSTEDSSGTNISVSSAFCISMEMGHKWIEDYEGRRLRHSKQSREPKEGWTSSKYPIENMHWTELQQLHLPTLGLNWGQACSSLKKLWRSYKASQNEPRGDIAWKIRNIQSAMGIEKSNFQELEWMEEESEEEIGNEELTTDEIAAKREEEKESGGDLNSGTSQETSEEWSSEDQELLKEEQEANDDWWFS